ncbi:unnamed protein product [Caenorhabditis nigoni]
MTTREYHIGKTVPEMIARLEEHDEDIKWDANRRCFIRIWNAVVEIEDDYDEMAEDQKLVNYKIISEVVQKLLNPSTTPNYKTMPHEKLILLYNQQKYLDEARDLWHAKQAAKSIDSKKTSAKKIVKIDWTPFQDVGNRVKTAVTGIFESMKKRIGKKKDEEE